MKLMETPFQVLNHERGLADVINPFGQYEQISFWLTCVDSSLSVNRYPTVEMLVMMKDPTHHLVGEQQLHDGQSVHHRYRQSAPKVPENITFVIVCSNVCCPIEHFILIFITQSEIEQSNTSKF